MSFLTILAAGTLCIGVSSAYFFYRRGYAKNGVVSTARIVDYSAVSADRYAYLCEYQANGRKIRSHCQTTVGRASKRRVGKKVTIIYNQQNPEKFIFKYDFISVVCILTLLFGISIAFLSFRMI